jgi:hypothetical protein
MKKDIIGYQPRYSLNEDLACVKHKITLFRAFTSKKKEIFLCEG